MAILRGMSGLMIAQQAEEATRALRLGNAWVVLLVVSLAAFGLLVVSARMLRPGRASPGARPEPDGFESVDPWEEAGRRFRTPEEDDGTIRHDGVRGA